MTFSILAKDPNSCAIGGAAATGSLCVGGWVLRGRTGVGMSASQGKAPSTIWGDGVLDELEAGKSAEVALHALVDPDTGKAQRQLSVLDKDGNCAVHSGSANTPFIADHIFEGGVAAGNMLSGHGVINGLVNGYRSAHGPFAFRLLAGLRAAEMAGSDIRGLQSAALLVLSPDAAPLTLRVDMSNDPLSALEDLLKAATSGDYAAWARKVPTLNAPERGFD